ncbi:hypothetical protein EON10_14495 [Pseudomonas aeruginosa]|nr:hypothetical protein [Pseudomonas aeruginosa]
MLPFIADMPPLEQERVVCSISAAAKYEVPANIVLAVTAQGGATPGNGTAMQQVIQEAARIETESNNRQSERQGQGSYSPSQQTGYVPRTITFQSTGAGQ